MKKKIGEMKKKTIFITKRSDDFHACLKEDEGSWDCGKTRAEAIGNLIITHSTQFETMKGIDVKWNTDKMTANYLRMRQESKIA